MRWDPEQYARCAGERGRPFVDLIARIGASEPRRVVDLGCGPGNLTALLPQRWPSAAVEGFDASPEMIAAADKMVEQRRSRVSKPALRFWVQDATDWMPEPDTDVIISNAVLQWVPEHRELLARWAQMLPDDGWLAFQVPGNFASPSHQLMREFATAPRWKSELANVLRHDDAVSEPEAYAALLLAAGLAVDVWETTYLHVLEGPDPVLEWVRGTGLRPILAALGADEASAFEAEYAAALRDAYPADSAGRTLFPFRRIFAVGHKR